MCVSVRLLFADNLRRACHLQGELDLAHLSLTSSSLASPSTLGALWARAAHLTLSAESLLPPKLPQTALATLDTA